MNSHIVIAMFPVVVTNCSHWGAQDTKLTHNLNQSLPVCETSSTTWVPTYSPLVFPLHFPSRTNYWTEKHWFENGYVDRIYISLYSSVSDHCPHTSIMHVSIDLHWVGLRLEASWCEMGESDSARGPCSFSVFKLHLNLNLNLMWRLGPSLTWAEVE